MELKYYLLDPTQNMTVLVETPVPAVSQPFAASRLLQAEPSAEQVGFLSAGDAESDVALRMAGGEFCGNATMSAAALFCMKNGLTEASVRVRASGAEAPVAVEVRAAGEGFSCTVDMPRPKRIAEAFGCPLVEFDGISHMIVTAPMERAAAEAAVKERCAALGAAGLGLMLLDEASETLTPLVNVTAPETLYWEHSCASGSAAVGAYLAAKRGGKIELSLREPGGILRVKAAPDGSVLLSGTVILRKTGILACEIPT